MYMVTTGILKLIPKADSYGDKHGMELSKRAEEMTRLLIGMTGLGLIEIPLESGGNIMKVTAYLAFVAMYYALDAAWEDGAKTDGLREYLSEINPFLWKGECSADPANYIEFKEAYEGKLNEGASAQDAYTFVKDYLSQINHEFVGLLCQTVNEAEWENALPEVESQIEERQSNSDSDEE